MERKSLYDISWQVDEPTYRSDPALSYSTIAKFDREGFNALHTLFDKVETKSLKFGSLVDCLVTGTPEEFQEHYCIKPSGDIPSEVLVKICRRLFTKYRDTYTDINLIPQQELLDTITDIEWCNHWKDTTRVTKIKIDCADYYKNLYITQGKEIISDTMYYEAMDSVTALKTAEATKFLFKDTDEPDIERLYQLKFKASFNGIDYRIMADEILVDHEKKVIFPIDLKTSSKREWDFYKSFIEWSYPCQGRLYWRVIRDNLDRDPYFKDFELDDYRFVVVNKVTRTPLVWNFTHTKDYGTLTLGKNQDVIIKDPFDIAKDLTYYLKEDPKVPIGINMTYRGNNIEDYL